MSLPLITQAIVETARISLPTVWESLRGRLEMDTCSARLRSWSARLLAQAEIELEVTGAEGIDPHQAYVIMSNHQSLYDIPILFQALPLDFRMVAKAELFRVPIWGRAMEKSGFVRIDRGKGREARAIMAEKGELLKRAGLSIWIAPEGTRSPSGELLPFRSGGFSLAVGLGLPILPVRINGAREILIKKSAQIQRGARVTVHIHPPLLSAPGEDPNESAARLKQAVFSLLSKKGAPS